MTREDDGHWIPLKLSSAVKRIYEPHRIKILKGGRGGTKSWTAADYHIQGAMMYGWRVLCGRETQKSIEESVHRLLQDRIEALGVGWFFDVTQKNIRGRNGSIFSYAGITDVGAEGLKSYEGYQRFWGEEAHKFSRKSIDLLVPTFRKDGSELMFTLNPELVTDEIWARFIDSDDPRVLVLNCSWRDNPWFPAELEAERQEFLRQVKQGKREQWEYDWIWEGKPKPAVDGAIYANQVAKVLEEKRLGHYPHDPALYTHLVWDLGWDDSMSIAFVQRDAGTVRFIDFIEDNHRTYDSYVAEIRERAQANGYRIALDGREGGKAWLPHDGASKNAQTGKSGNDTVRELGLEVGTNSDGKDGVPNIGIDARIRAGRSLFAKCVFHRETCQPLFNRLQRYARRINKETGQATGVKKDGNDHAGDMFTYVAVIEKELTNEPEPMTLDDDDRDVGFAF